MKILFAGNKERGALCLKALAAQKHDIVGVVAHPSNGRLSAKGDLAGLAKRLNKPLFQPENVNAPEVIASLAQLKPDLIVLAGYGPIVKEPFMSVAPKGCINLHGGKLPESRGSSPMNWALIQGAKHFTLSIIQVDSGVDSGDVLLDQTFPIKPGDTIAELDKKANEVFPQMLVKVVQQIEKGKLRRRKQTAAKSKYFPLRFPEDGFIVWDMYTAEQIHNRIRALTHPYPGAFTFFQHRKVQLLASRLTDRPFYGEPGRIYRISERSLLVCASDRCLWIDQANFDDSGESALSAIRRYDAFPTLRGAVAAFYGPKENR